MKVRVLKWGVIAMAFFSQVTDAAPAWFENVTITSTAYYWDGHNDVWEVTWSEPIQTGCSISDVHKKSSWWGSGLFHVGNTRFAPLMMALNAKMKVDLMIDPAVCDSNYGASLQGVRLRP